jgi:hypothetical protein
MRRVLVAAGWAALLFAQAARGQPADLFVLGQGGASWVSGGNGIDPTVLVKDGSRVREDTTNAPGGMLDYAHRPGWIGPLYFDPEWNIARRVLMPAGDLGTVHVFYTAEVRAQLTGMVNGDHEVAFERKPTPFYQDMPIADVWMILDFGQPVGIHRIRFYPRNTVVPAPGLPFQNDFMRGYEVWINPALTETDSPDLLVERKTQNQEPVVDIPVPPQYARLVKLHSLAAVPFEVDEIEVYGTGYSQQATYLSDVIDLGGRVGDRATVGPVRWVAEVVGDSLFSRLRVRARTGLDDTPVRYLQRVYDALGHPVGKREVRGQEYYALSEREREPLTDDLINWSPWSTVANGALIAAPVPRRYVQLAADFGGNLVSARQLGRLEFEYLRPPVADELRAEIYPRLAEAEKPATFRYAVALAASGPVRGYDEIEVDTNVPAENIRAVTVDQRPVDFTVESLRPDGFRLGLPLVAADGQVLEFTFDLPIFRFGTTFSGRAYNRATPAVPQALQPGDAASFGPDDSAELSGLYVAIPARQIGRLVGQISLSSRVLTPNQDGVNERVEVAFNLLQLVQPAPVSLEVHDLAGRKLCSLLAEERGIGPVTCQWDGRLPDGRLVQPGVYVWVLRVRADAFEERHEGTLAVAF